MNSRRVVRRVLLSLIGWAPDSMGGVPQRRPLFGEAAPRAVLATVILLVILAIVAKYLAG